MLFLIWVEEHLDLVGAVALGFSIPQVRTVHKSLEKGKVFENITRDNEFVKIALESVQDHFFWKSGLVPNSSKVPINSQVSVN